MLASQPAALDLVFSCPASAPPPALDLVFSCPASAPPPARPKLKKPDVSHQAMVDPEDDLRRLIDNEAKLRLSGYYYGSLSWIEASKLLQQCKAGVFLVRDSEHANYLYSLSVQTRRGPTSCRIEYHNGQFRLDSSGDLVDKMPRFDLVTDLVEHYVHLTKTLPCKRLLPVWLDMNETNSSDLPVQIYRPRYKEVRSLLHMCRVNMVRTLRDQSAALPKSVEDKDALPKCLKQYLLEYPYTQ